jgi:hypothetical protein
VAAQQPQGWLQMTGSTKREPTQLMEHAAITTPKTSKMYHAHVQHPTAMAQVRRCACKPHLIDPEGPGLKHVKLQELREHIQQKSLPHTDTKLLWYTHVSCKPQRAQLLADDTTCRLMSKHIPNHAWVLLVCMMPAQGSASCQPGQAQQLSHLIPVLLETVHATHTATTIG